MPHEHSTPSGPDWDDVAAVWQAAPQRLWRTYSDTIYSALFSRWLPTQHVERLLKTDLFDEAVNAGLYPLLASRARCVCGIDVSPQIVRAVRRRYPALHATCTDVRRLPFADGTFDVIVSNSSLDHFPVVEDLVTGLGELRRVLRQGGQLLLSLDNRANPLIALRSALPFRVLHSLGLVPYYVGVTCGPHRLRQLLVQAGFKVCEVDTLVHCPRLIGVVLARELEKRATPTTQQRYLRSLMAWEALARWPSRFLTGYYITVRAV